jgi:phosphate starvation-inducible PhoH-like protein
MTPTESRGASFSTWAGERGGMPEVTISLDGHAEELGVFGSRDQYLRQIRDAVGVKVLARHGEVRIEGDADRIEQARRIFEGLRSIFRARK